MSSSLTSPDIIALESAHTSGVTAKRPLAIVRGRGATLWDAEGNAYIDCIGGHGAANVGHSHPVVAEAIAVQAQRLMLCPDSLYNDQRALLLQRLTAVAPRGMDRAFLCNSGAEAVEAALKFARLSTGRSKIISLKQGFHGRTLGALSATWNPKYRKPFLPLVPDFQSIRPDLAEVEATLDDDTAAVLLEVVQGEGGVRVLDPAFIRQVAHRTRARGALLIIDEVQTGLGRTGKMWAHEHVGVIPDLMPIAKSLGGGFPVGACLIGEGVGTLPAGSHGSTFGGNPLACAAARATLDVIRDEGLAERAASLGAWFQVELARIDSRLIREVRGLGLMVGIDLRIKVTPVLKALQARGVLALPAGPTVLRLLPPLVITQAELAQVWQALAETLQGLE